MRLEVRLDRAQRVSPAVQLRRPVAAHHQQAGRLGPAGQEGDEIERRVVAPVEVLEDEHAGSVGRPRLEPGRQLPQHPRLRDRRRLVRLRRCGVARRPEPGNLCAPCRRVAREQVAELGRLGLGAAEAADCLQDRQVRLPDPVLLDALPAPHPEAAVALGALHERFEEGGLSDPRLSGHEDDPPAPLAGVPERVPEPSELRAPADEGRDRPAPSGCAARRVERRDEAVAAAADGGDEAGAGRIVAERPAQLPHADHGRDPADGDLGPDRGEELVGRHQPTGPLEEAAEDRKGLRPKRDAPPSPPEGLVGEIEAERRERDWRRWGASGWHFKG